MTTTPTPESVEALAMAIYCHSPDDEMPVGLICEMAAKAGIERLHSLGFTITSAAPMSEAELDVELLRASITTLNGYFVTVETASWANVV